MVIGMSNQIAVGSRVRTAKGMEGTIAQILDGGYLLDTGKRIRVGSVAALLPPEPTQLPPQTIAGEMLHIGDRVTLLDKFMVRAADVGTIEAISDKGIQVLWDNKSPHEPNLKQPPVLWRTFRADELELVESKYNQN
jgi:hypothetical protein